MKKIHIFHYASNFLLTLFAAISTQWTPIVIIAVIAFALLIALLTYYHFNPTKNQ